MNIKLPFIAIFLLCLSTALAEGPTELPEYRTPDHEKMESFLRDSDFQYERPVALSRFGPWERFLDWASDVLKSIFGNAPSPQAIENLLYLFAAIMIIWAIIKLTGMDITALFKKQARQNALAYTIDEEHIDRIDFEKEMARARQSGQLRLLIRLQYLFLLKSLADKGLVELKKGKTNQEYLYELGNSGLKGPLSNFSRIFEYTWYGHFEVSPAVLQEAEGLFTTLKGKLK